MGEKLKAKEQRVFEIGFPKIDGSDMRLEVKIFPSQRSSFHPRVSSVQ